ncbi:hypothetical protein [Aeromicrobium endophyticum]|uniref:Peptidase M11 gametolysin domain-containing protein n=1 Tax=Aeromicrobium endophyticum TaxID=2292704 RepID=A0A371PCW4_9ACTN|nr:hypothetical protein [Aeromicrobium endophyticum]REK73368.1 hypothetical protein DX116_07400 [Aeromicrobium endophyticum]
MRVVRRTSVLIAGALVASGIAMLPAQAGETSDPTTLAVEGTVRAVVVDRFGAEASSDHLYTVVTDAGAEIPVDLPEATPANGRFEGELVVDGDVEDALDAKDLLPREGSTIAQDTRAGRVAVAEAERQDTPLEVATSTVAPVTAAAVTTPKAHRAYVAVMTGRGSVEETDTQVASIVDGLMSYWKTESGGVISSFTRPRGIERFATSTAGPVSDSCGMASDPDEVWNEAANIFFQKYGVSFGRGSGNHLFVAMANECAGVLATDAGVAGVAAVGSDFSSEGPMSFSLGDIATQVGVHEIGHTFGLGHANLDVCGAPTVCGDGEYFDLYSPMSLAISLGSAVTSPVLDTAYRARLGVAGTSEVARLAAADSSPSRTVSLTARSAANGLRGLQVVDPISGQQYWVDYRSGTDRDAGSFYASRFGLGTTTYQLRYPTGVTVTSLSPSGELVLQTQRSAGGALGSFASGSQFVSPTGAVRIGVGAVSGPTAEVTVAFAPPAAPAPPVPSRLSPATPRISGTVKVGRTLRVKVGSWSPRPTFRYQWFANGRKISSKGTKASFRLTSKQKGQRITVRVTGTRAGYATVSKTSRRTTKVAPR